MNPTKPLKTGHKKYEIKTDFRRVFALFAGLAIDFFLKFFSDKKIKKRILRNHLNGFRWSY